MAKERIDIAPDKIKRLREANDFSQLGLSELMNYGSTYMNLIENGRRKFTPESLASFRNLLDLNGVPLTGKEIDAFKQTLHAYKDAYMIGDVETAKAQVPELEYYVNASLDVGLQNLFTLYSAIHNRVLRRLDVMDVQLEFLKSRAAGFNEEERYWYHRVLGIRQLAAHNYKAALNHFFDAEKLSNPRKIKDIGLSYCIAFCLVTMGNTWLAESYLDMAAKDIAQTYNNRYSSWLIIAKAMHLQNTCQFSSAIFLMESSINEDMAKIEARRLTSAFYACLAEAYRGKGDLPKAMENSCLAITHCAKDSICYPYTLYVKALVLYDMGCFDECLEYVNDALAFVPSDANVDGLRLRSLKEKLTLNTLESLEYIEYEAIPKFLERGMHLEVIYYANHLVQHFEKKHVYKKALYYAKLKFELFCSITHRREV